MTSTRWAIEWHSKNALDGESRYVMWSNRMPWLFHTRREARAAIVESFRYIAHRPDLRREPHGWRMPRAVRVKVCLIPLVEKEK